MNKTVLSTLYTDMLETTAQYFLFRSVAKLNLLCCIHTAHMQCYKAHVLIDHCTDCSTIYWGELHHVESRVKSVFLLDICFQHYIKYMEC